MNDETILILAAAVAAGLGVWGLGKPLTNVSSDAKSVVEDLTKPVGGLVSDVGGVLPWVEQDLDKFAAWAGGVLHIW